MPDPIDRQDFVRLCEMSIDTMYELEALGELLEQKGLLTKQEILTLAKELKQKNPPAESHTTATTDSSLQRFTTEENAVIEQLMAVILQHGLSADHAKTLLARTIQLLEWGSQLSTRHRRRTPSAFHVDFTFLFFNKFCMVGRIFTKHK